MKAKLNRKLDGNPELEEKARYFDNADIESEFDIGKSVKMTGTQKRVTMQIPQSLYQEAVRIGNLTGTGYQNAIKVAMAIGFKNLDKSLDI